MLPSVCLLLGGMSEVQLKEGAQEEMRNRDGRVSRGMSTESLEPRRGGEVSEQSHE
jgi:hypothetical protein